MNNHPESEEQRNLIHRALADENWHAFDAQLRKDALQALTSAKRRRRRIVFVAAPVAALIVMGIAAWTSLQPPKTDELSSRGLQSAQNSVPNSVRGLTSAATSDNPASDSSALKNTGEPSLPSANIITEDQMLAMFPPGSCLLAEINGQMQLVFLDVKIASEGVPLEHEGFSRHN